ncbi:MAG: hypothetical protein V4512_13685 [Pseudomonadota bacterium]
MAKAPSQEISRRFCISAPRVQVADIGREKFQKAHVNMRRSFRDNRRQGQGRQVERRQVEDRTNSDIYMIMSFITYKNGGRRI